MDAVELPLPVDVAAPTKLMGSEGYARARVTVKEMEDPANRVSIFVSPSIECCNSPHREDNVANVKNDDELLSRDNFEVPELCNNSSQLPHIQNEEVSKNVHGKGRNGPTSRLEGVPSQRKAGKVSRNNSSCSKRIRMSQSEDCTSLNGIQDSKDFSDKMGSHYIKCSSTDKSQLLKQKRTTKRGDRRNFKVPAKAKFDSSSMKLGAGIFSSSCGGNNFFGLYGLKHDIHDVTKLENEPPLDELLRGTFDCPSLSKDKGKKVSNMNESLMNSVRKACSILQLPKRPQSQNVADVDSTSNKKMSTCQLSSFSVIENGGDGDKTQPCITDVSCQKDPGGETTTLASPLDFPLYEPKDVLELIVLSPSWDLESLLLEASKPAVTSKSSNDIRPGKQITRHPSLPAFPWSHAFGGHCRTNSDAVKLSTNRSTCLSKWARIGVIASSAGIDRGCFTNLDSYGYDQSLVPSAGSSDNKVFPSLCASLLFCQWDSESPATCSKASQATGEFEGQVDNNQNEGHCPSLLVAAQTLYEIATHLPRQNPGGIISWQKKSSIKSMKARKFKSNDKCIETLSTPISVIGSDLMVRSVQQIMPSKKPRLSIVDRKDSSHSNNVKQGLTTWPTSKSSRSLSSKSVRDPVVENRHSTASILKQHSTMTPPSRVLDKSCDSQQKARKLMLVDWKRARDKSD